MGRICSRLLHEVGLGQHNRTLVYPLRLAVILHIFVLHRQRLQVADAEAVKHDQSLRRQLNAYQDACLAGLQPDTVFKKDVDRAWKITEATGVPYRGDQ